MKKQLPKLLIHPLLATMGTVGALLCVTTAFSISVNELVITLASFLTSLIFTACLLHKKALWVMVPVSLAVFVAAIYAGFFSSIGPTLTQLVHDILERFSSAYPNVSFAIPSEPDPALAQSNTLFFSVLAVLLSLWMAWGVGYHSCVITIAGTLPFLLLCVIINDTPPRAYPLVLLLSVWVTMLLLRERPGEPVSMEVTRTVLLFLSVLLLLGVIGIFYPKDDTSNKDLPEVIENLLSRLPGEMQSMLSRDSTGITSEELGADTSKVLDLTQQGTRDRKDTVMLQLSTTETGPLYLRGAAKDIYTGTSWESSDEATQAESVYAQTSLGASFGTESQAAVQIKNLRDSATVLFAPYGYISCTSADTILSDLRIGIGEDDYIIYYWPGVRGLDITTASGIVDSDYDEYVYSHCLQLPEDTKQTLYDLAISYGYDPSMSEAETIAWVAEFIRSAGIYQLNVSRQPVNYDFAVYFLTESKAGYCVHFATAAAAMYRALGIPSRYASGYRVTVTEANSVTNVTDRDTHAWAEVYLSGLGWIPVETTPGFGETSMLPEVEQEIPETPSAAPSEEPAEPSEEASSAEELSEPSPSPSEEPEGSTETGASPSPSPSSVTTSVPASAEPSVSTAPDSAPQAEGGISILYFLSVPALLLLLLLILLLRRALIRRRRRRAFRAKNTNQAVLNLWQYASRLTLWGAELPEELEELALKAKFSRHQITQEELAPYRDTIRQLAISTCRGLSRFRRFRFRLLAVLDWPVKAK